MAIKNTPQFPGAKHKVQYGRMRLEDLKEQAQKLAAKLGPDHPDVKLLRKEIADRGSKIRR